MSKGTYLDELQAMVDNGTAHQMRLKLEKWLSGQTFSPLKDALYAEKQSKAPDSAWSNLLAELAIRLMEVKGL